jgi:hypothetical protein
MDEIQLRLDGNACAGLLREVFVQDVTGARGSCANCGAVGEIGAQHLYDYPDGPGAVLRCSSCESVLMVLVRAGTRYRLGAQGLSWMEIQDAIETEEPPEPAEAPQPEEPAEMKEPG